MRNTYLIINGTILTGEDNILRCNEDLLLVDGAVSDIGKRETFELPDEYEVIDAAGQIVMPAFYNLHVHLGESIFRGKCDGMDLWEYLDVSHNTYDIERWKCSEADIHRLSGLVTIIECLENGAGYIVCNRGWDEIKTAQVEASCLFPIVNISKLKDYYNDISSVETVSSKYAQYTATSIFLQSMYLCDEERFVRIKQIMDSNPGFKLFVHIAETVKEQEYIRNKYGCTPMEALDRYGLLTNRTFCVHSIYLSENDRKLIKNKDAKIVLCPVSNLKLGDGYPDVEALLECGIQLIAATDGFATNNSASLLEELKTMALLSHGKIPPKKLLDMITVNPAKCMHDDEACGIIKKGYKVNISMFEAERYNIMDYDTAVSNLIYNHSGFRCRYVISGGKLVFKEGKPVFLNKEEIVNDYCKLYARLYEMGD